MSIFLYIHVKNIEIPKIDQYNFNNALNNNT